MMSTSTDVERRRRAIQCGCACACRCPCAFLFLRHHSCASSFLPSAVKAGQGFRHDEVSGRVLVLLCFCSTHFCASSFLSSAAKRSRHDDVSGVSVVSVCACSSLLLQRNLGQLEQASQQFKGRTAWHAAAHEANAATR